MFPIDFFPTSLLIRVLTSLDHKDIVRTRRVSSYAFGCRRFLILASYPQVSRKWWLLIEYSEDLKFIVWLGIHRKAEINFDSGKEHARSKIARLLEHEKGWSSLISASSRLGQFESSGQGGRRGVQLVGVDGTFILTKEGQSSHFTLGRLASKLSGVTNSWLKATIDLSGTDLARCAYDASDDLIVIP